MLLAISTTLICISILSMIYKAYLGKKQLGWTNGMNVLFAPISLIGPLLPESRLNPGLGWHWKRRHLVYQQYGSENISVVPFLHGRSFLYTSSLEVASQVLSSRAPFVKSVELVSAVSQYGTNLFTANGMEWRRHRRIMGPAFTNETYSLIWNETAAIYFEMCTAEGWDNLSTVAVPAVNVLTTKVALMVLARCAFGKPMPWIPDNDSFDVVEFGDALVTVSETFIERLALPRWIYSLPIAHFRKIEKAYTTLTRHIHELIDERRTHGSDDAPRFDVFSLLIQASEAEGKLALSADELVGNTFFLLFAGHETMSHIWNATIGLLALYDDVQQEIYGDLMNVVGDRSLTYSDSDHLHKVLACFLEAGRLFPAGYLLMREATEDVVLTTYDEHGFKGSIPLEQGANVAIDLIGLHYNARHFPEPEEYRPSRWYDKPESELSIFSVGPRACIGRKFATTEACCFLSHLLRDWKLQIILESGESREQWRARVLRGHVSMTFGVGDVPVRLVRRA
ncbi:cytochrome P450 [Mycena floridula]|nr:cytochrome P450 [Mycena floridula]